MTTNPDQPGRRFLLTCAVRHYDLAEDLNREELDEDITRVTKLFCDEGLDPSIRYTAVSLGDSPESTALKGSIRAFFTSDDRREDDYVVLYLACHGEVLDDGGEYVLLTRDSNPRDLHDARRVLAQEVMELALAKTKVRNLLVMFDACYSGSGSADALTSAVRYPRKAGREGSSAGRAADAGIHVMAASRHYERALPGGLTQALERAVAKEALGKFGGYSSRSLPLTILADAMNGDPDKPPSQTVRNAALSQEGEPYFVPNPEFDPRMVGLTFLEQDRRRFTEAREQQLTQRFRPATRSFIGRHHALIDLAAWVRDDPAPASCIVTGDAGSGKTAVLALLSALADPDEAPSIPRGGLPPGLELRAGAFADTIHAGLMSTQEVLERIAWSCGVRADSLPDLVYGIRALAQPPVVIVDALDEARDPDGLIADLLNPLTSETEGRIRLLMGCRRHLLPQLRAGDVGPGRREVDLDSATYADPASIRQYARTILLSSDLFDSDYTPSGIYRSAPEAVVEAVTDAIAQAAGDSFLIARIVAMTEATVDAVPDVDDNAWRDSLPSKAGPAMQRDLEYRLGDQAARAVELLLPVAYGLGDGLPWEDLWPRLASALSVEQRHYDKEDIIWLRRAAGSYVVEGHVENRSVYRIFHKALVEHLMEGRDDVHDQAAIVGVLLSQVDSVDDRREWARAHPYIRAHLLGHAASANQVGTLLTDPGLLLAAPRLAVLAAFKEPIGAAAQAWKKVFERASPQLRTEPAAEHAAYLRLAALYEGLPELARQAEVHRDPHSWWPLWTAFQSDVSPSYTIQTAAAVRDFRVVTIATRDHVVCSLHDGSVVVLDLESGQCLHEPFQVSGKKGESVGCLAVAEDKLGRPFAAAGLGRRVHVWDLRTGAEVLVVPLGRSRAATALAFTEDSGALLLLVGTSEPGDPGKRQGAGEVSVWDVGTGHSRAPVVACEPVSALTSTTVHGELVVVHASGPAVHIRGLRSGELLAEPILDYSGQISEITVLPVAGRPVVVVDRDDNLAAFDVQTLEFVGLGDKASGSVTVARLGRRGLLVSHQNLQREVRDSDSGSALGHTTLREDAAKGRLEVGQLDGKPVVVSSFEGQLQVTELIEGEATPQRDWSVGQTCAITSLDGDGRQIGIEVAVNVEVVAATVSRAPGRPPMLVATSGDGRVLVFDHESGASLAVYAGHLAPVLGALVAQVDGRLVVASWSTDQSLHVWDPATSRLVHPPLRVHTAGVTGACLATVDGMTVLVTGSNDGSVALWDLSTGALLRRHTLPAGYGQVVGLGVASVAGRQVVVVAAPQRFPYARRRPGRGLHLLDPTTGRWRFLRVARSQGWDWSSRFEDLHLAHVGGRALALVGWSWNRVSCIDIGSGRELHPPVELGLRRGAFVLGDTLGVLFWNGHTQIYDAVRGRPHPSTTPPGPEHAELVGSTDTGTCWSVPVWGGPDLAQVADVPAAGDLVLDDPVEFEAINDREVPAEPVVPEAVRYARAVAVVPVPTGDLVVAGTITGEVRTWTLSDGEAVGRPLTTDASLTCLAVGNHEGGRLLVVASRAWDRDNGGFALQMWDLDTGEGPAVIDDFLGSISTLRLVDSQGRLLVVTGSDRFRGQSPGQSPGKISRKSDLRLLDPLTRQELRHATLRSGSGVEGLVVAESGGKHVVVALLFSGELSLWTLETLRPVRRLLRRVRSKAGIVMGRGVVVVTRDGAMALVSRGEVVALYSLPGLDPAGNLEFRLGEVRDLAVHQVSGRLVAAVGRDIVVHRIGDDVSNAASIHLGSPVNVVAVNSGSIVVAGTQDGVVVLDVPLMQL